MVKYLEILSCFAMELPRTYQLTSILISFSVPGEIAHFMEFIRLWSLLAKSPDDIRGKCKLASPVFFNFYYFKISLYLFYKGNVKHFCYTCISYKD